MNYYSIRRAESCAMIASRATLLLRHFIAEQKRKMTFSAYLTLKLRFKFIYHSSFAKVMTTPSAFPSLPHYVNAAKIFIT